MATREVNFKEVVESNVKTMREQATTLSIRAAVLEELGQLFENNGWKVVQEETEVAEAEVVTEDTKATKSK